MLCITRRVGDGIKIRTPGGEEIEILMVDLKGKQARVGIKAGPEIKIHRSEFFDKNGELMTKEEYQARLDELRAKEKDELAKKAANRIKKNKSIIGLIN